MPHDTVTLDHTFGVSDDELSERFKEIVDLENKLKNIKGVPVAKYDKTLKKAYLEYPDGRKEYVDA